MSPAIRLGVYAEANMNLLDGSSVWVQRVCSMLARVGDVQLTLLLRASIERELLLQPLIADRRIELVDAVTARGTGGRALAPPDAVDALEELDADRSFDIVLIRGWDVLCEVAQRGQFGGRLWVYLLPDLAKIGDGSSLRRIAALADRVLCQTPAIAAIIERFAPETGPRLVLLPPIVPDFDGTADLRAADGPIRRLFYAGKFAPEYWFLEMVQFFRALQRELPDVELHIAGDKIHNPPGDPDFKPAAERALKSGHGVVWHGALPWEGFRALLSGCDVGLSLLHPGLDMRREISTKTLEYGMAGKPVLLNRTRQHEAMLGYDYPLFAGTPEEATAVLSEVSARPQLRHDAAERLVRVSAGHTFTAAAESIRPHVLGAPQRRRVTEASVKNDREARHPELLVAGHTFHFVDPIPNRVLLRGGSVRVDRWVGHAQHDEEASLTASHSADIVFCEWCLGNAVFYSRRKRDRQRLVVRFHRQEIDTPFPHQVELERVDEMIFVAQHVLDQAVNTFGWPADRLRVVENAVDVDDLMRPKLPDAEFNLGLIGFVPRLKRLDRALDILEILRSNDARYRLVVKGKAPWEFPWMLHRDGERDYFREQFARVRCSPLLKGAVSFEHHGPDIAPFLQKIGFVLSTSDLEGHAVSLAEGIASGSIPVVLERVGAREQYADTWVHPSAEAAANAIASVVDQRCVQQAMVDSRKFAQRWSHEAIMPVWDEVLGLSAES